MNMPAKIPTLHQRLNDLENELKELHDRILEKRQPFNRRNVFTHAKLLSKQAVQKKREQTPLEKNTWNKKGQGRDLIGQTASLTEITSLSSGLQEVLQTIKKNEKCNLFGLQMGEQMFRKKKSKFVLNNKLVNEGDGIENHLSEILKYKKGRIVMESTNSEFTTSSPKHVRKNEIPFEHDSTERAMDDQMLDLRMLKERIDTVKKKLRDERTKREIAERAIIGYRRRIAILEGKNVKKEDTETPGYSEMNFSPVVDIVATLKKQLQEGNFIKEADVETKKTLATLEKELNEERTKRQHAEKLVTELKSSLEENQKKVIKLEEGRTLAVAMADQFRDKATKNESQEVEKLKSEKAALEMELKYLKEANAVSPEIVQKLIERAERAEKELIEKMKQCNNFMAKSSLNDPEVVKLIEKYKKAYAQLQTEKKSKENELKNRCNGLIKDIEAATVAADKRYREISEKYNLVIDDINKKESDIEKMENEKKFIENDLRNLKIKLQEVVKRREQQEEMIRSLKEAHKSNDEKIEKMEKEKDTSRELYLSLEAKYNKFQNMIVEKEKIIEKLKLELEHERDSIKVKDKMLQDQADTIKCLKLVSDNTKKSLDAERNEKHHLLTQIDKLENSHEKLHNKLATTENKLKEKEEERTKEEAFLKQLEYKVRKKHMEWQLQIVQVTQEKEKAINTARFATEKLIKAINDYENKLNAQKKIQGLLNTALKEKEYQLHVAKQQANQEF